MRITDQTGSDLGYLTNEAVREILQQSDEEDAKLLLTEINERQKYVQWISLPEGDHVKPYEIRIIRYEYLLAELPKSYSRNTLTKNFFDIPEFEVTKEIAPTERVPTNITIISPEGFRLNVETVRATVTLDGKPRSLKREDHYNETFSDNVIDVSLPHITGGKVGFHMHYGLYLERNEQSILRNFILGLVLFSVLFAVIVLGLVPEFALVNNGFAFGWLYFPPFKIPVIHDFKLHSEQIATVLTLTSLVFIGLTTNPLTHRTKYWAFASVVITTLSLLFAPS